MNNDHDPARLSAFLDGELSPAETAVVTAHLATCPACVRRLAEFGVLRAALAEALPEEAVSEDFRAGIAAALDRDGARPPAAGPVPRHSPIRLVASRLHPIRPLLGGVIGAALAAMVMLAFLPRASDKAGELLAVRDAALRTAMPIGAGQAAGAPALTGYRLIAARADVIAGHSARVLTYAQAGETITLCLWRAHGEPAHGVVQAQDHSMPIFYWNNGTDEFWATSAHGGAGLHDFVAAVRHALPGPV